MNKAIPHAVLHHTGLYLMNLTDIAELLGMTKQNLSKYARVLIAVNNGQHLHSES